MWQIIFPSPHTSSLFWPETWEKVWNLSHPYTFLFNSAKSCARSKARLWERDPGGIKGELRASLQDTDRPTSHGASPRHHRLFHLSSCQLFFLFQEHTRLFKNGRLCCTYVRRSDVITRPELAQKNPVGLESFDISARCLKTYSPGAALDLYVK